MQLEKSRRPARAVRPGDGLPGAQCRDMPGRRWRRSGAARPLRLCSLVGPTPPAGFPRPFPRVALGSFLAGGWSAGVRPAWLSSPAWSLVRRLSRRRLLGRSRRSLHVGRCRYVRAAGGTGRGAGSLVRPRGPVGRLGPLLLGALSVRSAPPIFAPGPRCPSRSWASLSRAAGSRPCGGSAVPRLLRAFSRSAFAPPLLLRLPCFPHTAFPAA